MAIAGTLIALGLPTLAYLTSANDKLNRSCNAAVVVAVQQRQITALLIEQSRSERVRGESLRLLDELRIPEC